MDTSTPPAVDPPQTPLRWREVAWFCVLTYGFSWAWWAPQVLPHLGEVLRQGYGPAFFEGGTSAQQNWGTCGMFGPMLAAGVMRLWVSRDGFRGSVGILRSWRWYALAATAPIMFVSLLLLIEQVSGVQRFIWTYSMPLVLALPLTAIANGLLFIPMGFGEEYGWRGYLLPRLLALGETRGTLVLGLIWGFWHLPVLLIGLNYPGQPVWFGIPLFLLFVVILAFPFTWLFRASRSGVLVVSLMHTSFNALDPFTRTGHHPPGNPLIVSSVGIVGTLLLLCMVVPVGIALKRRRQRTA